MICDRLPYSVDQTDCSQKGFSRVLRVTYNQEYCRYEPGCYLNFLIGLLVSSASHHERHSLWQASGNHRFDLQKHFYDSLCLVKAIDLSTQSILDVGSGAGFPSIPLKIVFPDLKITIIDALNKRIKFLELLTNELGIQAYLVHGRAEEFERKNSFDIVTARAVANLRVLSELCIPFVKLGGVFIALKGPKYIEELSESQNAIKELGGIHLETKQYQVVDQERSLLIISKVEKTQKKYPRIFAQIKKNPL